MESLYACVHVEQYGGLPAETVAALLLDLGLEFSPEVEETAAGTIVFSIVPLRKLIGSPHQIASEICRAGYERKLQASLAVASNPDAAILLARHFPGVTLVTPGEERRKLGGIPLAKLFAMDSSFEGALLQVLHRWGVKTCEDLAVLPESGVAERLGQSGIRLRQLARGSVQRPLRLSGMPTAYEQRRELDDSLHLLEPLLFLLGSVLTELCGKLRAQSRAARLLEIVLELEENRPYTAKLEFPVALDNAITILKLLQLHLERHPPAAPIKAFTLRLEPVAPRRVQGGIFLPPTPQADKLQLTLARIAGLVGTGNVGTPRLLNTHRPDAFEMLPMPATNSEEEEAKPEVLRLAMRLFRPALQATVQVVQLAPKLIVAAGVKGKVTQHAGPWKTAGEWWAATAWSREEWDVALDDGALYRIYQESASREWFVHGVYD
jgi:protein ImuB